MSLIEGTSAYINVISQTRVWLSIHTQRSVACRQGGITMRNNLLIIGAGQYGMIAKEIAEELGYEKIDFLDGKSDKAIGTPDDVDKFEGDVIVAIGNAEVRGRMLEKIDKSRVVSLISPHAYVSPSAVVSPGCVVEPMAVVHTGAKVGIGCFISAGAVVNHDCVLEDCCHIDCNSSVMKASTVPAGTKVESNMSWTGEVEAPKKPIEVHDENWYAMVSGK